jgi:hypothetical protein
LIPAQDHSDEPRCPDCGSVDPCEHDDPAHVLVSAVFGLAAVGALTLVVLIGIGVVSIVRWL